MLLFQMRQMADASRCFWGLSLSLSALYLVHSMSTPQVTPLPTVLHLFWSPQAMVIISLSSFHFSINFALFSWFPQVYIVYLGHARNRNPFLTSNHHLELLSNAFERHAAERTFSLHRLFKFQIAS